MLHINQKQEILAYIFVPLSLNCHSGSGACRRDHHLHSYRTPPMTTEIYLDANATSTVLPAAMAAADHAMREGFGNPSSTHATGLKAKSMLDGVRARAVRLLGTGKGKLIFTSGATEG